MFCTDEHIDKRECVSLSFVTANTGNFGFAREIKLAVKPLRVKTKIASAFIFSASFTDVDARICQSVFAWSMMEKEVFQTALH